MLHKTTGETSNNIELVKISPSIILEGEKSLLIDEWQKAVNLNHSAKDASKAVEEYINLIICYDLNRLDSINRDNHIVRLLLKSLAIGEITTISNMT